MAYLPHSVLLDITIYINGVSFNVTFPIIILLILAFARSVGNDVGRSEA